MTTRNSMIRMTLGLALLAAPAFATHRDWNDVAEIRDAARNLDLEARQLDEIAWDRGGRYRTGRATLGTFTELARTARTFDERVNASGPEGDHAMGAWQPLWIAYVRTRETVNRIGDPVLRNELRDVEYHMNRLDRYYDYNANPRIGAGAFDRNDIRYRQNALRRDVAYDRYGRPITYDRYGRPIVQRRPVVVQPVAPRAPVVRRQVVERPVIVRPVHPVIVQRVAPKAKVAPPPKAKHDPKAKHEPQGRAVGHDEKHHDRDRH